MRAYFLSFISFTMIFFLGVFSAIMRQKVEELLCLLFLLFIPIILTFVISQWVPIYIDRQIILFSPFYYIIVAIGLSHFQSRALRLLLLLFISGFLISSLHNYYSDVMPTGDLHHYGVHPKKPYNPVVQYIKRNMRDGDIIGITSAHLFSTFQYYWGDDQLPMCSIYMFFNPDTGIYWRQDMMRQMVKNSQEINFVDLEKIKGYNFKRIWLVLSEWRRPQKIEKTRGLKQMRNWMDNHYERINKQGI